jgi:hypothetical protein
VVCSIAEPGVASLASALINHAQVRSPGAGTPATCSAVGDGTGPGGDAGAVATKATDSQLAAAFAIPLARDPCALGLEPDDVVGRRLSILAASVQPFINLTLHSEQIAVC